VLGLLDLEVVRLRVAWTSGFGVDQLGTYAWRGLIHTSYCFHKEEFHLASSELVDDPRALMFVFLHVPASFKKLKGISKLQGKASQSY
jgi:hypothetical protein